MFNKKKENKVVMETLPAYDVSGTITPEAFEHVGVDYDNME